MEHIYEPGRGRSKAPVDMARCRAAVHDDFSVRFHQCGRAAKVFDEEKMGWCTQHSPEVVAAKRAKQYAKWKAEMDQLERKALCARVGRAFVEAMGETGDVQAAGAAAAKAMGRG